jgi:hypothetical protein
VALGIGWVFTPDRHMVPPLGYNTDGKDSQSAGIGR